MSATANQTSSVTPEKTLAKYDVALTFVPPAKRTKAMGRGWVYAFAATVSQAHLTGVTTVSLSRSSGTVTYFTTIPPTTVGAFTYKDIIRIITKVRLEGKSTVEVWFTKLEAAAADTKFPAVDLAFVHALGRIGHAIPFVADIYELKQGKKVKSLFPFANRANILERFAAETSTFELRANEIKLRTSVVLSARGSAKPSMEDIRFRIFNNYKYDTEDKEFILSSIIEYLGGRNSLEIDFLFNPETGLARLKIKGMQRLSQLTDIVIPMLDSKMLKHLGRRFIVSPQMQEVLKREELKALRAPLTVPVTFKHMGWSPTTFSLATGERVGV